MFDSLTSEYEGGAGDWYGGGGGSNFAGTCTGFTSSAGVTTADPVYPGGNVGVGATSAAAGGNGTSLDLPF
jgi:hypothetical protein